MADIFQCVLCGSNSNIIEKISSDAISKAYHKNLGVEVNFNSQNLLFLQCPTCSLKFFKPMELGDEEFYDQLQKKEWYYLDEKWEYHRAAKHISRANKILEVGCGFGAFSSYVGRERYRGLELSGSAVENARHQGISVEKTFVEDYAMHGQCADAVVNFQVLEHIPNPRSFLQGCIDCLEPGGKFLFAVPSDDSFVGDAVNNWLNMPPHHGTRWPDATLRKIAEQFSLELVALEHEPVASIHREWATKVIWQRRIREILQQPYRVVDNSMTQKMFGKGGAILKRLLPPNINEWSGHSVLAVYRKIG